LVAKNAYCQLQIKDEKPTEVDILRNIIDDNKTPYKPQQASNSKEGYGKDEPIQHIPSFQLVMSA
jgi:hypothetical protein